MTIAETVLVLLLSSSFTYTRYTDDLLRKERSMFTDHSAEEFMCKLNALQNKMVGMKHVSTEKGGIVTNGRFASVKNPEQQHHLFEGDIVLTDEQMEVILENARKQLEVLSKSDNNSEPSLLPSKTNISNVYYKWISFPIPFTIDRGANRSAILAGIKHWEDNTCLTFAPSDDTSGNISMIRFIRGSGCYSNIGRIPGRAQNISIGDGCTSLGTVAHEIGHALGYFHEQSRYDRDAYVRIIAENVQNDVWSRFAKQPQITMATYGVGYDFGSVMHYQKDAFSSNGKRTVATLDTNYQSTIGQRIRLSFADIKKMNFAYCNETCPQKLQCLNNGYTDPKNCLQCRCPDGLGGELCNEPKETPYLCEPLEQNATTYFRILSAFGRGNCNFRITAPANRRVTIQLDILLFRHRMPCTTSFVEVRYGDDLSTTGARFCGGAPKAITSTTSTVIVLYRSTEITYFLLRFRYDPLTVISIRPPDGENESTVSMTPPTTTVAESGSTVLTTQSTTTTAENGSTVSTTRSTKTTVGNGSTLSTTQSTTTTAEKARSTGTTAESGSTLSTARSTGTTAGNGSTLSTTQSTTTTAENGSILSTARSTGTTPRSGSTLSAARSTGTTAGNGSTLSTTQSTTTTAEKGRTLSTARSTGTTAENGTTLSSARSTETTTENGSTLSTARSTGTTARNGSILSTARSTGTTAESRSTLSTAQSTRKTAENGSTVSTTQSTTTASTSEVTKNRQKQKSPSKQKTVFDDVNATTTPSK